MIGSVLRIRYEILQEIDEGPVFATYRARDRVVGRDVCVRILQAPYATETEFVTALKRVVKQVSAINHPSVERIYDMDDHEGVPFIISEMPAGHLLSEKIKRLAPFSAPLSAGIVVSILEGLDALHSAGIVHGDLSSKHVMLLADSKAKICLGGIWESYAQSRTAGVVVLPAMAPYMAPEITSGVMPNPVSDIYAAGVVLFELLTGRLPFGADTPVAMALKHATAPIPSLRSFNSSVPAVLEEICKKALIKTPSERYQSANEMMGDLRVLMDAMRFGKSLSWPIKQAAFSKEPAHVAPKMSAVRPHLPDSKRKKEPEEEVDDGLPQWLVSVGYACVGLLAVMIASYLAFNFTAPKKTKVPNVVGLNVTEAAERLRGVNLQLKTGKRLSSEKYPLNQVIATDPEAGGSIREYATVIATISAGSKYVDVPELRGRTIDDARELLTKMGLELGDPVVREQNRQIEAGKIFAQVPEPRKKVERSSKIRIKVSAGASRTGESSKEVIRSTYQLKITMPPGDTAILVRVDMTDDNETRTIEERSCRPGEVIEVTALGEGKEATFRIFFDGELVKHVTKAANVPTSRGSEGARQINGAGANGAEVNAAQEKVGTQTRGDQE